MFEPYINLISTHSPDVFTIFTKQYTALLSKKGYLHFQDFLILKMLYNLVVGQLFGVF